jgi:bifunctional UDP-N-acetylglucosamine pyrophosphorylase/glucosamine-1-phosphate N-acetyltransferase
MQAVILAAGRGTRMGKLTEDRPKPMLEVARKTLLEWKFDALPDEVDEIIIVIGYLGEKIREKFGDSYKGKKVTYVEQANIVGGTMDALLAAKPQLRGRFFVMNGDDLYAREDMQKCLAFGDWAILVLPHAPLGSVAHVLVDDHGLVTDIVEADTHGGADGLGNAALYLLDERIFYHPPVKVRGRDEIGIPQTMLQAKDIPIHTVETTFFMAVTAPEDLEKAARALVSQ